MKILHAVEFYSPSVGGSQEVVRQVSEGLAARGHAVTVATTALDQRTETVVNGIPVVSFRASGNAVRGLSGEIAEYRSFVESGGFDVTMFYAAQQWTTDAALDLVGSLQGAAVLAPCGFSGLREPTYAAYFANLPTALRRFDALIVHSGTYRDAWFLREAGIEDVAVIPNGAAEEEFDDPVRGFRSQFGIDESEPLIVSVGSHTGLKGHAEAIDAVRSARSKHATLAILGNSVPGGCVQSCRRKARIAEWRSLRGRRIIVAEVERPLVVSALTEADLVVHASRVECSPLVLFEAMAAGTPFVASRAGNSEEIAATSEGGLTVTTTFDDRGYAHAETAALAGAVGALLDDPARRREMGARGREAWKRTHTWSRICERYEEIYAQAIARRRSAGRSQ